MRGSLWEMRELPTNVVRTGIRRPGPKRGRLCLLALAVALLHSAEAKVVEAQAGATQSGLAQSGQAGAGETPQEQEARSPQAKISNGLLQVTFDLPDKERGYYRGTRFDWSGVIADLTFAGHHYYGPWYVRTDPSLRDYVFTPEGVVTGLASSITGPVEEFLRDDGSALGYAQAKPGGTFVKIGVGALRRPDGEKYSPYRIYDIVDGGRWKVQVRRDAVTFTQRLVDKGSGYGYLYTKTVRLVAGQPKMVMEHTLTNLGRLAISTQVFDHNFEVLDGQPIGTDFTVTLPFPAFATKAYHTEFGGIDGNRLYYTKQPGDNESFTVHIGGFRNTAADNDIRVENQRLGAGVRITGDHPLLSEEVWSIRSVIGAEPYLQLDAAPGETIHWSYTYVYYTLPAKK